MKKGTVRRIFDSLRTRAFRKGTYTMILALAGIAAAVAICLFVGALPQGAIKIDTTPNNLYTLSGDTDLLLDTLDKDVTIYLVVQSGNEDDTLQKLLDRYESANQHISITTVDPVNSPGFLTQYTSESLYENSLVVECGDRYTVVSYYDVYTYEYNDDTGDYDTYFDGESLVTSAIHYVTNEDDLPVVYKVSGHGELDLNTTFTSYVERQNVNLEELNLLTVSEIPDNCSCLFILSPESDISESEAQIILNYLKDGGRLLCYTDYTEEERPNLMSVLEYYGVTISDGILIEGNGNMYVTGYNHYLFPYIDDHEITSPIADRGYYILAPVAQAIVTQDDLRDGLTVEPLLTTSSSSFIKILDNYTIDTYDYEDGDEKGAFDVGTAITEGDTRVALYSTSYLVDENIDTKVAGANSDLFINSLNWLVDSEGSISVHAKSLTANYLTIPAGSVTLWSVVLVGVLPLAVLIAGGTVWYRRRRK